MLHKHSDFHQALVQILNNEAGRAFNPFTITLLDKEPLRSSALQEMMEGVRADADPAAARSHSYLIAAAAMDDKGLEVYAVGSEAHYGYIFALYESSTETPTLYVMLG